jgi:hypothetical protein
MDDWWNWLTTYDLSWRNHDLKQFMSMDEINIDGWIYPLWLDEFHVGIMSNEIKRVFEWMGNDPTKWNFL